MAKQKQIVSLALGGFEEAIELTQASAAEVAGEELTAMMRRPKADISARAGKIERESPLFYGSGSNPTLFN